MRRHWLGMFVSIILASAVGFAAEADKVSPKIRQEIVRAVRFALSLESAIFELKEPLTEGKVFRHFRQGYGNDLANRLTHIYFPEIAFEPTSVPDNIQILNVEGKDAKVYYKLAKKGVEPDGSNRYILLALEQERGRWIIVKASGTPNVPIQ